MSAENPLPRPDCWPDGRPLGGRNGYSPEWYAWAHECSERYVSKQIMAVKGIAQRRSIFDYWKGKMPGIREDEVRAWCKKV